MATSTIKRPLESVFGAEGEKTLLRIGIIGTGSSIQEKQFVLPKATGFYFVFVYKTNPTSETTQGMYFVDCYLSSTTKRMIVQPFFAVSGPPTVTGGYDADEDEFILRIAGQSNFNARIYRL